MIFLAEKRGMLMDWKNIKIYSCNEPAGDVYCMQGCSPKNLENEIARLSTVPMSDTFKTANGCEVKLVFSPVSNPTIRREIAGMILNVFEQRSESV